MIITEVQQRILVDVHVTLAVTYSHTLQISQVQKFSYPGFLG